MKRRWIVGIALDIVDDAPVILNDDVALAFSSALEKLSSRFDGDAAYALEIRDRAFRAHLSRYNDGLHRSGGSSVACLLAHSMGDASY